jgi:hypothetical protein
MTRTYGTLTPEERAEVMHIQDRLIELFVDHRAAVADQDNGRASALRTEIDELLQRREAIENWSTAGSA